MLYKLFFMNYNEKTLLHSTVKLQLGISHTMWDINKDTVDISQRKKVCDISNLYFPVECYRYI